MNKKPQDLERSRQWKRDRRAEDFVYRLLDNEQNLANCAKRQGQGLRRERYGKGASDHFKERLEEQLFLCGICDSPLSYPVFDHNHETGQWRGALCAGCNAMLGPVEDAGFLKKALAYLAKWRQN